MKAIDNLRTHMKLMRDQDLTMMAMSTVKTHLNEIERELEEGYVELPTDENGEHIHIGDKLMGKYLEGNPIVECTRLTLTNGWMVGHGRQDGTANLFIRHKPPTVEDVLREFAKSIAEVLGGDEFLLRDDDEMYAEFAERLQLRKEDE